MCVCGGVGGATLSEYRKGFTFYDGKKHTHSVKFMTDLCHHRN